MPKGTAVVHRVDLDGQMVIETIYKREAMNKLEQLHHTKRQNQVLRYLVNGMVNIRFGPGES